MKEVVILRDASTDAGTPGKLIAPRGFECYTLELPWRQNVGGLSCIPLGEYELFWGESPNRRDVTGKPEWTYRFKDVPGRAGILVHAGNFAGDKDKGYVTDVEGCILLGRAHLSIEIPLAKRQHQPWIAKDRISQFGISSSRDAVAAFVSHMGRDPFKLTIKQESA